MLMDFRYLLTDLRAENGFYVFKWLGAEIRLFSDI